MTGFVRGLARFWYDFIVGDDWRIAVGVVAVIAVAAVAARAGADPAVISVGLAAAVIVVTFASIVGEVVRLDRASGTPSRSERPRP